MSTDLVSTVSTHRTRSAMHHRTGWPLAAIRPDYTLYRVNGPARSVRGRSVVLPDGPLYGVAFTAELRLSTRQVLTHALDPHATLLSRSRILGEQTVEEFEADGAEGLARSLDSAVAAAGSVLGLACAETGTGAEVVGVRDDTLEVLVGDVLVAVDGVAVGTATDLDRLLRSVGATAVVQVLRAGTPEDDGRASLLLRRHDDGRFGLRTMTRARRLVLPLDVSLDLPGGLGGPSLGLVTALSVLDRVTDGSLTGGAAVAATGAISLDGSVLPVGGVTFKARSVAAHGVETFLVPAANESDVSDARRVLGRKADVVPVGSLTEALRALGDRCGNRLRLVG